MRTPEPYHGSAPLPHDGPIRGPGRPPSRKGLGRRAATLLVTFVLVIVVAAVMTLVHLPYVIYSPGPATNTLGTLDGRQIITVKDIKTYPTSGALDFTTVSLYGGPNYPVNGWDWLRAKFDSSSTIAPVEEVFPKGVTGKQVQQQNTAQMQSSQDEAMVAALRATGRSVPEDVVVAQVMKDSPAKGTIKANDVIRGIDGTKVASLAAAQKQIAAYQPGDTVPMTVERHGKDVRIKVKTRSEQGRTVVGVYLTPRFHFPVDVKLYAGQVGGPSAGMMFGLGIYDTITPGQLTGGLKFAGTGTLDSQGHVGPIGGIQQKLAGAHKVGAQWFLAPADNCNEVVGHIPDGMQVVKVSTFTEARHLVKAIGEGKRHGLPRCTG